MSSTETKQPGNGALPLPPPNLDDFDCVMFDCDGVLWLESTPIPGAKQTVEKLLKMGKRVLYVTNNATQSRQQYTEKFKKMGIPATKDQIFTSAYAGALYLLSAKLPGRTLVFGEPGLSMELEEAGLKHTDLWKFPGDQFLTRTELDELPIDPEVSAVLCGLDSRLTYSKVAIASSHLLANPQCKLISTNNDAQFPAANRLLPGAGAIVSSVQTVSGRTAINLGKPEPFLAEQAIKRFNLDRTRCLMVGDRLETDIVFGKNAGIKTCLVMSGVTTPSMLASSSIKPDFMLNSVADF